MASAKSALERSEELAFANDNFEKLVNKVELDSMSKVNQEEFLKVGVCFYCESCEKWCSSYHFDRVHKMQATANSLKHFLIIQQTGTSINVCSLDT